jgi:hypothetical protein
MTEDIQIIALQWLKRLLFPDFTNKLTWLVALAGIALVGGPSELIIAGLNWVVAFINQHGVVWPPLPEILFTPDPMGYWLVVGALVHNLANKAISLRLSSLELLRQRERRTMDIRLFESLTELLPSNGPALTLAKEHDFANSFRIASMEPITEFVHTWDNAEHEFLDAEIEIKKKALLGLASDFTLKVAEYTAPGRNGMQTAIPSDINVDFGFPEHVQKEIRHLNQAASGFHAAHQSFIRFARERL